MSHTISARTEQGLKVEVADWNGLTVHSAFYADRDAAQDAAQHWERIITNNAIKPIDGSPYMSDDEIMRELLG